MSRPQGVLGLVGRKRTQNHRDVLGLLGIPSAPAVRPLGSSEVGPRVPGAPHPRAVAGQQRPIEVSDQAIGGRSPQTPPLARRLPPSSLRFPAPSRFQRRGAPSLSSTPLPFRTFGTRPGRVLPPGDCPPRPARAPGVRHPFPQRAGRPGSGNANPFSHFP